MEAVTVFGAGSWGTAVARLLARGGVRTCLWARRAELAEEIRRRRENATYLPGVSLPATLEVTSKLEAAAHAAQVWLLAVPSFAMRELARRLRPWAGPEVVTVSLAKGLETDSLAPMSRVIREELPAVRVFALSGPSHAEEVGRDYPTSVVIAGEDLATGRRLQALFMSDRFRPYLSDDLAGVEYAGVVKNVIALAAGISDGLGFGDNAKGALLARGLAELVRLGVRLGTRRETLFGLSGLGDLVATCTSRHSRNRAVGERLGRGEPLSQILDEMTMVAEGVPATRTVRALAHEHDVEMPITEAVYAVLYRGAAPLDQLSELMSREPKEERF